MKIVKPSFEIWEDENPLKIVEKCARLCYKSEDKITEDSYKRFCLARFKEKHYAIFEHANFVFSAGNEFFRDTLISVFQNLYGIVYEIGARRTVFTLNLRHIFELCDEGCFILYNILPETCQIFYNDGHIPLKYSPDKVRLERESDKERFVFKTVKLSCQRAIWDELARHRKTALCCESSRYVKYDDVEFGDDVGHVAKWCPNILKRLEEDYLMLRETFSCPAQTARYILPLGYNVNCVVTASLEQWKHIFEMRTSKAAHPDMQKLMKGLKNEMQTRL